MLRSAIAMLVPLLLLGCRGGATGAKAPTVDGEPTGAPAKTSGAAKTSGPATPEEAPAGAAAAGEGAAAPGEGTVVAPVGTTPAEAMALCNDLEDPTTIVSCTFVPGGKELPGGGRVDVLELASLSDDEVKHAYAVLRVPGEYPLTERMAEERSVPGEESVYRLEPIALAGNVATFRATETVTTYPNTGDPDEPSGEYDEVSKVVVRCSITDVECEKEVK